MKFSLPFYTTSPYNDTIDELMINYTAKNNTGLIEFLSKHPNQRIVLKIEKGSLTKKDYDFLKTLQISYTDYNFVARLEASDMEGIANAQSAGCRFFINYYCSTYEEVQDLIAMGVTDIYITNFLGFHLDIVKEIFKDINIRVFPNIAQTSSPFGSKFKAFFIPPQALYLYENIIDYIEFYAETPQEATNLFKIYKTKIIYNGDLGNIITNFPKQEVYNETIPIEYFEERVHCRKRCVTGSCSLCDKFINLAKTIKNTNHKICFEEGNNEK